MKYRIIYRPEVENDVNAASDWYGLKSPVLQKRFQAAIRLAIRSLKTFPKKHQIILDPIRRYVIKTFPYVILYEVIDYRIEILAIIHTSRDPEDWMKRLP